MAHVPHSTQTLILTLTLNRNATPTLIITLLKGQFKWADGSRPRYTNWSPGEPNDYKKVGGEDCVVVNWHGNKWNDVKCVSNDVSEGYVCSATVTSPLPGWFVCVVKEYVCEVS